MPENLIAGLCGLLMLCGLNPLYLSMKRGPRKTSPVTAAVKGLCTGVALALAVAGALREPTPYAWGLTAGLALCLLGDVVLIYRLVPGMGAFLAGHFCYIAAFCLAAPPQWWSLVVFAVLLPLVALLFRPHYAAMGRNKPAFITYAVVLLAMVSTAVPLPVSLGPRGWAAAAGAVLFTLSDLLLARNMLGKSTPVSDAVSLTCYYTGQYVLALSVFLF